MLRLGKRLLELLVLALRRPDLVDAPEDELRLLEPLAGRAAHLHLPLELALRIAGGVEGVPVCLECLLGGIAHPGVQHLDVSRALQQTLVLVLAAQVDGRSRPLGELAH